MRLHRMIVVATGGACLPLVGIASCQCSQTSSNSADVGETVSSDSEVSLDIRKDSIRDTFDVGTESVPSETDTNFDGVVDLGADTPFVGTWSTIPGASPCDAVFSLDPGSFPQMKWTSCSSATSGCRQLVTDWAPSTSWAINILNPDAVRLVSGRPLVNYVRRYARPDGINVDFAIEVIQPIDDKPIAAIGTNDTHKDSCSLPINAGEFGLVINGTYKGAPSLADTEILSWAAWSSPAAFGPAALIKYSALGGGEPQSVAVGNGNIFVQMLGAGTSVFDPVTRRPILLTDGMPPAEGAVAVGGGAFGSSFNHGVAYIGENATWSDVIKSGSGKGVTWVGVDRSLSNAIVYVEVDLTGVPSNPVLWTSPFGTTPGAMAARAVAKIATTGVDNPGYGMVANEGFALVKTAPSKAVVFRLSDGVGWTIDASPLTVVQPVWISAKEAWISVSSRSDGYETGILRFSRSGWGPPDVDAGI